MWGRQAHLRHSGGVRARGTEMPTLFVLIPVAYIIAVSRLTSWLAIQKGYGPNAWLALGFFFHIFALIAIAGAPTRTRTIS